MQMSVRAQKIQSEASCLRSKLRCFSSFTKKMLKSKNYLKNRLVIAFEFTSVIKILINFREEMLSSSS